MPKGPILVAALFLAAGCGGPAIVDASRQIAELRSCAAAELTVSGAPEALTVGGCGEPAVYACADGPCRASEASPAPDADRVREVTEQLAGIAEGIASCAEGADAPTVQVYIGFDGKPNGLALHPDLGSDVRACIGHLVLDAVEGYGGAELLVSYRPGAPPVDDSVVSPVSETMETVEPVEEPVEEPIDEPIEETDADGTDAVDADGADPDGADPGADDQEPEAEAEGEDAL